MKWKLTNGSEKKEPLFSQNEIGVLIDLGSTKATNDLVLPMVDFILKKAPVTLLIQKENTPSATVYISTSDRYNFLIKNAYGIGYTGEGSRGLETLLMTLNVPSEAIKTVFNSNSDGYIQLETL